MSDKVEMFSKNLVENAMIEALELSGKKITDVVNRSIEQQNVSMEQNSDAKVNKIEHTVNELADLFEDFHVDVQDLQIGDYLLHVKISPLEIQLKRAISSIHISEVESKIIMNNGRGDTNVSSTLPPATSIPPATADQSPDTPLENEKEKVKKRMTLVTRLRRFFRLGNSRPRSS